MPKMKFAFDRGARTIDVDGRLHVQTSNISKATVNDYYGKEIPGFEQLGLDPEGTYALLRAPEELQKGAETFNHMPLLSEHVPVSAADHRPDLVVGSTGTDTVFESPYLKSSLVIWDAAAIKTIESREQAEISCAYRYLPDMTPGTFDGIPYDGVMREIVGNHVALVTQGRAGPDVVVADSANTTEKSIMPSRIEIALRAALGGYLRPMLAQDASISEVTPLVRGVTIESFTDKAREELVAKVVKAYDGKLDVALDPKELAAVVADASKDDDLKEEKQEASEKTDEETSEDEHIGWNEMVEKLMKEGNSRKDAEKIAGSIAKKKGEDEAEETNAEEKKEDSKAMDERIKKAQADTERQTIERMNAIRVAEKEVAPLVGEVAAMDSAAEVYKFALDQAGIDMDDVHPSAYRAMVRMIPSEKPQSTVAQDASAVSEFRKQFPDAVIPRSI